MFSYRHAFHAGNHADVLKHTVLIATVQYLTQKEAALTVLDTHGGAGLYRLDGDYASFVLQLPDVRQHRNDFTTTRFVGSR